MGTKFQWIDPSEKEIENAIFEWLAFQRDIFAFKVNTVGVYDQRKGVFRKSSKWVINGTPDIIACMSFKGLPIFVSLEVKSAKGVQSKEQIEFEQSITQKVNGFYFLVRSVQDAQNALNIVKSILDHRLPTIQTNVDLGHSGHIK